MSSPTALIRHLELPVETIRFIRGYRKECHEHLFRVAVQTPSWVPLALSSPALGALIAFCWEFDKHGKETAWERMPEYVNWKRCRLCEAFGFPSSRQMVRLLARVGQSAAEPFALTVLQAMIADEPECIPYLCYLEGLSPDLIWGMAFGCRGRQGQGNCEQGELPGNERPRTVCLLNRNDLGVVRRFMRLPRAVRALLEMLFHDTRPAEPLIENLCEPPRSFGEFPNARKYLFHLIRRGRQREIIRATAEKNSSDPDYWPCPPIIGTKDIVAIASREELEIEAAEMRHCVDTFVKTILAGGYFVYRVLAPERATLAIAERREGWRIAEICGPGNENVSSATRGIAENWLKSSSPNPDWQECRAKLGSLMARIKFTSKR